MTGGQAAEHLARFLGRRTLPVLLILSILIIVPAAMRAAAKPFWHDEIYTLLAARLPSLRMHWAALRDGVDFAPPFNGFATRAVIHLAGDGPVAARVPAMVGFLTMALVVYAMVRQRSNATYALAAAFIPCFTAAYRYAYDARPYGLMMGLAALAWWSWAEAAAGRRRRRHLAVLWISLAAGLWNHYYAVLVYLPIAAGELVRATRTRRIDAALWASVATSLLAAIPLSPLIGLSAAQAATFWVRPSASDIPATYGFLFSTLLEAPFRWAMAAIVLLVVVARFRPQARTAAAPALVHHEVAAAIASVLLPAIGVVLALLVTGAFVPRYAMPAVVGASIVVPLALARLARRAPLVEIVLLGALSGSFVASLPPLFSLPSRENPVAARPLLLTSLEMPGPTVASGELWYLQLWYYAPAALKSRLVYLADPETALRYRGSDIVDRNYLALARWTAVPVMSFDRFVQQHAAFRIYASGAGWLLDRLAEEHARVEQIGSEAGGQLYHASLRPRDRSSR